ncbi:hypothetical protein B0F90DRAFT_779098 [Multifurca ochricompacta]|uniref:Uncharacterized protein n=1 Tax=Multifurca ochricompacta TaxID=376703 RepID=A0AAD4QQG0_9AGAM|nr:hypothetical protein B0F90DRAFT_779098 [Multifurca ochricompacta]
MPSLRRAISTPSVRISPYPSPPGSHSYRPHPYGYRRSSGPDVSTRKVLADIDWWRVADGQREQGNEEEDEERDVGEDDVLASLSFGIPQPPVTADHSEGVSVEFAHSSTPVEPESSLSGQILQNLPQSHLSHTPTRRTTSESSALSLESTPEVPEVLSTPLERLSFADMGFADPGPEIPLFRMRLASHSAAPLASKHVFPGKLSLYKEGVLADPLIHHDDLFA